MISNINLDKMLKEQNEATIKWCEEEAEREEDNSVYFGEMETVTKTSILDYDESVMLVRYIYPKIHKVVFDREVKVTSIVKYLDLSDKMFIKCALR